MEIGCGVRVRDFDGRRYFYFWHYERDDGCSTRREEYVGRVDSERARSALLRRMAAYHRGPSRNSHVGGRGSRTSLPRIPLLRGTFGPQPTNPLRRPHSMYLKASAGGMRDARTAG